MLELKAKLELYKGPSKRQSPFKSGYRPLFILSNGMRKSGAIRLLNKSEFFPGEIDTVVIQFVNDEFFDGDLKINKILKFDEGTEVLGEILIQEIYGRASD